METELIITLISTNIISFALLGVACWVNLDGILNMLRLKLQSGRCLIFIIGKDKKLYQTTARISGKRTETEQIDINGLPYTLNRAKIIFYKTFPVLIFDEGVSEPCAVNSGELNYGKLTPELLSQMLAMARQSGRLPNGNKQEQLMFYMAIASVIGIGLTLWFVFNMSDSMTVVRNTTNAIATAVNTLISTPKP